LGGRGRYSSKCHQSRNGKHFEHNYPQGRIGSIMVKVCTRVKAKRPLFCTKHAVTRIP
jgi:hypothetical protein